MIWLMKPPVLATAFLALLTSTLATLMIFYVSPASWQEIGLFLVLFFFALSSSLTIILYQRTLRKLNYHTNQNLIFTESFRRSTLFSSGVSLIAFFKVTQLINEATILLLITILICLEVYFKRYH